MIMQLEKMVGNLEAELERERLERSWSESERDRVKSFWEIAKRDLEDKKTELRNLETTAESTEERHQLEIKVTVCSIAYAVTIRPTAVKIACRLLFRQQKRKKLIALVRRRHQCRSAYVCLTRSDQN